MAMLVGVADYADTDTPDLTGPTDDIQAMHEVLIDQLGVPAENICVLQDAAATQEAVEAAFQRRLVDNARPGDSVFFYFSGHGSRQLDQDREETDGYDETLLLHDYDPGGEGGRLVDDALGGMLGSLHAAMSGGFTAPDIVLIFDACFSGTATRGSPGAFRARQVPPATSGTGWIASGSAGGTDEELSSGLEGMVVLAASRDDTVALEPADGGGGLFTQSLTATLNERASGSTWRQIAHHTARLLEGALEGAEVEQRPTFQGGLDRAVLSGRAGLATSWEVTTQEPLILSGIPMPGWGVGAEVRLLPADTNPATLSSALLPQTMAKITAFDGFQATVELIADAPLHPIQIGDKAILIKAASEGALLPVTFDETLPEGQADALKEQTRLFAEPALAGLMRVSPAFGGGLLITDAQGRIRNHAADDLEAARWLKLHARQHTLRQEARRLQSGELEVQAVPYPRNSTCGEWWEPCPGSAVQVLPACDLWQLEVSNKALYDTHYQIGGVLLASDGCIIGLPEADQHTVIRAATTIRLDPDWAMVAENTGSAPHELLLFGYPADAPLPVPWSELTSDCSNGPPEWMASRGEKPELPPTWTATTLTLIVSANPHLEADACPATCSGEPAPSAVDIQPFLPPDPHPLRAIMQGLSQSGGAVSAAMGTEDLSALPACACDSDGHDTVTLHPGDVVTLDDAASALVISDSVPLLWGEAGFVPLDRRETQVTDCRRPDWPTSTAPEPMACYCCGAP